MPTRKKKAAKATKAPPRDRRKPGVNEFLFFLMSALIENRVEITQDPEGIRKVTVAVAEANNLAPIRHDLVDKIKKPDRADLGFTFASVALSPTEVAKRCVSMLENLSGGKQRNQAIAKIVQFATTTQKARTDTAERQLIGQRIDTGIAQADQNELNNILAGNYSVI